MVDKKRYYIKKSLGHIAVVIGILLAINFILSKWIIRIDLTEEKRFTLTTATKNLLGKLDAPLTIDIYLEGKDLPAGIKKIKNATADLLKEFSIYAHGNISYNFIDINNIESEEDKEAKQKELISYGLSPINLQVNAADGYKEKLIFPGAIFNYKGKKIAVQLLENQSAYGTQGALDNSVSFLEYKSINAIHKLTQDHPVNIGFLQGQGEAQPPQLADMLETLVKQNFHVQGVELSHDTLLHQNISALIVAKPTLPFSEEDKAVIDQYVMQGGKILWMVDNIIADMDSFKLASSIFAIPRTLNLDDMLFRYGVRINSDILLDLYCNPIPIVEEINGNPETRLYPWTMYPLVQSVSKHPLVRNLDPVMLRFAGSIDTIKSPGVQKTILYTGSQYCRLQRTPFQIFLEGAKQKPLPELYNSKFVPVAVLLSGIFKSHYAQRMTTNLRESIARQSTSPILAQSLPTKMIVVSDGDVMINEFDQNGIPMPLGYYKYTKETFANKEFLLNCVQYLTDDFGLIEARNRETRMRLLDKAKLLSQKSLWQIINIGIPILLLLFGGIWYTRSRKSKYATK